jgi:site-specific DNA-cytosine methylase
MDGENATTSHFYDCHTVWCGSTGYDNGVILRYATHRNHSNHVGCLYRLRRFDPDEILAISGFPPAFTWPPSLGYEKRWACIGNSVNVAVVRGVMACLFEPDAFD